MVHLLHRREPADDQSRASSHAGTWTPTATDTEQEPQVVTAGHRESTAPTPEGERGSVMRVPVFSPLAPILGWLLAWGVIATAAAILDRANVDLGFNLGIANGGQGMVVGGDDGFLAGAWLLLVSVGAFLAGGYAAARMARSNGTRHAALMWIIAMVATGADAIVETMRDGSEGVIRLIGGVPFWAETGLTDGYERTIVFAVFAAAQLVGSLVGGGLGQVANRIERSDGVVVVHPGHDRAVSGRQRTDDVATDRDTTNQPHATDQDATDQEATDQDAADDVVFDQDHQGFPTQQQP